ncbi:MAG TPA: hypothetical protein VFT89_07495 [Rhizobiaceae bacterium]|nr:hypothetical protein [Rhizobiaceae bacterium]
MLLKATITDPMIIPDTFVSGLGTVEEIGGGCFRFTFYATQSALTDGEVERVVVARLVAPLNAIPPALILAAKAIGCDMVAKCPGRRLGVH